MAHTLDEVLSGQADQGTKLDALAVAVAGIPHGEDPAKVDAVFDGMTTNTAKVQAIQDSITPPIPVPTPTP